MEPVSNKDTLRKMETKTIRTKNQKEFDEILGDIKRKEDFDNLDTYMTY